MYTKSSKSRGRHKRIVTIDLDMTVADHRRRLKRAASAGSIDKSVLFSPALILSDKVMPGAEQALKRIRSQYEIIFLTSRQRSVAKASRTWLRNHRLMFSKDKLIVVESEEEKLRYLEKLSPRLYAVIDDFKFDYQSGKPRISAYVLPHILSFDAFVIVFDNNWRRIIKTYFS